jgi:hypothetical protein
MSNTVNIAPTWHAALCHIVPAAIENGGRDAAIEVLEDAASKLDLLSRFIDSDDRVLRMLQDFQQQEAAR